MLGLGGWGLGSGARGLANEIWSWSVRVWGFGLGLRGIDLEYLTLALRCMESIIFVLFYVLFRRVHVSMTWLRGWVCLAIVDSSIDL